MASIWESERIRVAKKIAVIPTALRERALEVVERSYQQNGTGFRSSEADAQGWISAMMFRLRSRLAEHEKVGGNESELSSVGAWSAARNSR